MIQVGLRLDMPTAEIRGRLSRDRLSRDRLPSSIIHSISNLRMVHQGTRDFRHSYVSRLGTILGSRS